jgi:adenosyl cobinamide kinase/adenosyl cobinamide phosphate guanylyltransferase
MITLLLGGSRSGKSTVAERLVGRHPDPVTYVATMVVGDDPDLATRVERHRRRRPSTWATMEAGPELADSLRALEGSVLLDSLGPWLSAQPDLDVDAVALCSALVERHGDSVVVSDEVGMGVHPPTSVGRQFRDALGSLNQAVASVADRTYLIVAGQALPLVAVTDL